VNTQVVTPASRRRRRRRESWTGWLSILPAIALALPLTWYPLTVGVWHSFTKWNGMTSVWIGLGNYRRMFIDGEIFALLRTNLIFFAAIPVMLVICMVVSVLLHEKVPGWRLFRSLYYIPTILSIVIVGYLMRSIFLPSGLLNLALTRVGLESATRSWLEVVPTAFLALMLTFLWQTLGQGTLIFLAGLSAMDSEVVEAATIDGAGWWQRLFRIILPLQTPAISYFFVTNTIYVFIGLFTLVYTITGGGPGTATTPLDFKIYIAAFRTGELGYASALSVVLLLIVAVIALINVRQTDRQWAEG